MNGYSNSSGFSQSLNGIVTLTDGITQIENGNITTTGNILSNDIVSSTVTTGSLKSDSHEVSSLTIDDNLLVNGITTIKEGLSDALVTLNCGVANLNSSNRVTCVDLICSSITCKNIRLNNITNHYTDKIGGYLNIAISPYLKIPLITSIYDTTTYITNYDLSTILINTNLNSLNLLPYYMATFYNDNRIIFTCDNSTSTSLLYNLIVFDPSDLICTKILISYKNIII